MIQLDDVVNEGSTIKLTVDFLDVNGDTFTPKTCEFSLTDKAGTVINDRDHISATVTGTSHDFVLYGLDTSLDENPSKVRVFTVEGTYDSTDGSDLPFREEARFTVVNTVVSPPSV